MNSEERIRFLYELGRSQTDHEQQNSAELSTRAGLLAALAGLIAVGLTEIWRFSGTSRWNAFTCVVLVSGVVALLCASVGETYERPASSCEWFAWIQTEEMKGRSTEEIDEQMLRTLCDDYAESARIGIASNDKKSVILNRASMLIIASLLCLLIQIFWASFSASEHYKPNAAAKASADAPAR